MYLLFRVWQFYYFLYKLIQKLGMVFDKNSYNNNRIILDLQIK